MAQVNPNNAPGNANVFFKKGSDAMERNNLEYAMDMFEAVLKLEPEFLDARRRLRECAIRKAESSPPGKLSRLKAAGRLMQLKGRIKKDPVLALAGAEHLLREDPLNLKLALLQSEAARAAGLPEAAAMSLEMIRKKRPGHIDVLEPLADLYRELEQFDLEFECREKLADLKPTNGEYAKALKDAAARLTMGKTGWQKAESYREMVKQQPDEKSELERAREAAEKAPQDIEELRKLAELEIQNRLHDESIQTLEKIIYLTDHPDPVIEQKLMKAREHQIAGQVAEAEDAQDIEKAHRLRDKLNQLRIEHAAKKTERHPNDLQLKFEYGKLLLNDGAHTEAIVQLQQAARYPQRRIRSLLFLAEAFKVKGQLQVAKEQLETALNELPEMDAVRKEALYETGLLAEELNASQQAMNCFREIYAVDIGYRDVARRVEKQPKE